MIDMEFQPATNDNLTEIIADRKIRDLVGHLTFTIITPYDPQIMIDNLELITDLNLRHRPEIIDSTPLYPTIDYGNLDYRQTTIKIYYEFQSVAVAYATFFKSYSDLIIANLTINQDF